MRSSSSSSSSDGSNRGVTHDERSSQKRRDYSSSGSSSSSDSGTENKELGSRERIPSIASSLSLKSNKSHSKPPSKSSTPPKTPSRNNTPSAKPHSPTPSTKSQTDSVKSASSISKRSIKSPSPPPKSSSPTVKTPTPPPKSPNPPPKTPEAVASKKKSSSSSSSSSSSESEEETKKEEVPKIVVPPPRKSSISSKQKSVDRLKVKMKSPTPMNDDVFDTSTPPKPRTPKSARFKPSYSSEEPIESELHIMKYRNTRSAPARPRGFYAESSNLAFLKRECDKIERSMKKTAKSSLGKRPKITPYKPFTWNSLAPYYNTDTLRYMIHMPVTVRRGYNTRATASGMVDPEVSWKMDHCLTPMTPSRPELFRHHYTKRRTQSAMPRLTSEYNVLTPRFPKVTSAALEEPKKKFSGRNSSLKKSAPVC